MPQSNEINTRRPHKTNPRQHFRNPLYHAPKLCSRCNSIATKSLTPSPSFVLSPPSTTTPAQTSTPRNISNLLILINPNRRPRLASRAPPPARTPHHSNRHLPHLRHLSHLGRSSIMMRAMMVMMMMTVMAMSTVTPAPVMMVVSMPMRPPGLLDSNAPNTIIPSPPIVRCIRRRRAQIRAAPEDPYEKQKTGYGADDYPRDSPPAEVIRRDRLLARIDWRGWRGGILGLWVSPMVVGVG